MSALDILIVAAAVFSLVLFRQHPISLARLRRSIAIDTRSLAVFRVLIGLVVTVDTLLRLRNLSMFYTDDGVVPRYLARALIAEGTGSIFLAVGDPRLVVAVLILTAVVGLQLSIGYRTRLATVLVFLLIASIDARNVLVLSYADTLLRLLLFWAIFLPLGARWSLDARQAGRRHRQSVDGLPSALILLQVVLVLLVNAFHKAKSELWRTGDAMTIMMGLDDFTYVTAELLRELPAILQLGGLAWYLLSWFSPLLLVLIGRARALYLAPLLAGNILLALSVRTGAFPFVFIAGLLLFVQTPVWSDARRVGSHFARRSPGLAHIARVISYQFSRALEQLADWLPTWRFPQPRLSIGRLARTLVVLLLVAAGSSMVLTNLDSAGITDNDQEPLLAQPAGPIETAFLVGQPDWTIFAPAPRSDDYYYVFPARTGEDARFDLYSGGRVSFDRPTEELHRQYATYRHRFYLTSIRRSATDGGYANAHVVLAEYYCARRIGPDGERIANIDFFVVSESVTRSTIDRPAERQQTILRLYAHDCGVGPAERPPIVTPPVG